MPNPAPVRVAIDLETTGLQTETESIIEVGAVKFRGDEVLDTFESFIDPRRPLPYRIQRLTRITPAMLTGAPQMSAIAPQLRTFLGDLPLVGHNVGFDAAFLRRLQIAERNALLDTFELASLLLPSLTSYTLEQVGAALGLSALVHHRALADAHLSRAVLVALEARIADLPDPLLNELCGLAAPSKLATIALLRQEQQRRGQGGGAFPARGGTMGGAMSAKLHIDPAVLGTQVSKLAAAAPSTIVPVAGPTEAAPSADLRALIETALTEGQLALVQIAPQPERVVDVLVPALAWAVREGKRLVIAASSLASARAIGQTHLPRALASLPEAGELTQATLYEARDYLCLHRWYGAARKAPSLSADTLRGMAKLTMWMHQTETGTRDEINLNPTEQIAWEMVRAGETFLALPDCAYRGRGWCFGQRARGAALAAQVVVTTHAALLGGSDEPPGAAPRPAYVPPADGYLILDGHELEERLLAQASWSLEQESLLAELDQLGAGEEKRSSGLLANAAAQLPGTAGEAWGQQVARTRVAARDWFAALGTLASEGRPADQGGDFVPALRLDHAARALPAWGTVAEAWNTLEKRLHAVAETTAQAAQGLRRVAGAESLALELAAQGQQVRQMVRRGRESMAQPREGLVYWVRPPMLNGRRPRQGAPASEEMPALHGSPANVAAYCGPTIQGLGAGVVIVGTALAVDGRFEYTIERLGLPANIQATRQRMDYADQTLMLIPSDAAEPNAPAYQRMLNDAISQTAIALGGEMVVLLSSHTALRTTYAAIKPILESHDIMVLGQGIDGSLRQVWQNYRSQSRVVILGAGNMWEGWESEQARPRCLFIARLPLPALNDPPLAARAEQYGDAMQQFVVPQAALRLRQALNRLAWAQSDARRRNVVILYDRRVQTKSYGATILNTLPNVTQRTASLTLLGTTAREWLEAGT